MTKLTERSLINHGALTERSLIDHVGKGREGKGREGKWNGVSTPVETSHHSLQDRNARAGDA